jgi:hypothetical protein
MEFGFLPDYALGYLAVANKESLATLLFAIPRFLELP